MKVTTTGAVTAIEVSGAAGVERMLLRAGAEAADAAHLDIVHVEAPNGDVLSVVVGGDESVLGFQCADAKPPYYASRGAADSLEPFLVAYADGEHHTEFPRKYVIPMEEALAAVREFTDTHRLPECVRWETI